LDTIMSRRKIAAVVAPVVAPAEFSADPSTPVVVVDAAPVAAPDAAPVAVFPAVWDRAAYVAAVADAGIADAGIVAVLTSPACIAVAAGMIAARATADTADAVNAGAATFAAAAAAIHPPTSAATVNVGRFMGRKIMDGQNVMYAVARIVRVPDAAIAAAWRAEWPGAKCDFAVRRDHVTTTRPVVNRGGHGWTNGHGGTVDVVAAWGGPFRRYTAGGDAR